jgi:ATP-dependent RNA helicase RhlE
VFTRTKHGASRLSDQLIRDGIAAAAIHGNKSQPQRVRALDDFKAGRVDILVATDLAARGLDIEALPHVVNYELPMTPEDYVHRIGRTGRAGVDGIALSLVCVDEAKLLRDIEGLLGRRVDTQEIAGFAPDRTIRPEPIRLRSGEPGYGRLASRAAPGEHRSPGRLVPCDRPWVSGRLLAVPSPVAAPGHVAGGRHVAPRSAATGRPGSARPAIGRPPNGRPQTRRHELRPLGVARAEIPAERPPWARDAGRVDGRRQPLPRSLPGERLSRLLLE